MRRVKSLVWALGCAVGMSVVSTFTLAIESLAQNTISPDDTLGSERSSIGSFNSTIDVIEGGATRGQNLFHSFEEFSIDNGYSAYFIAESDEINNMFARVTGSARSDIFGVLGTAKLINDSLVPASADLYLINPSGIVFGENAILDVDASFVATTANSVGFGTEEFSTTNPALPSSTLTVDPSTYLFIQSIPADIESRSTANGFLGDGFLGLRVPNRENLTFVGGDITINGGDNLAGLHAFGGRVELIAVREPGVIDIGQKGEIVISETIPNGNVLLTDRAQIDVSFDRDGDINIISGDIDISNASLLNAGISEGLGFEGSQAGDIVFDAARKVTVESSSRIENDVDSSSVGDAGNITINSNMLEVRSGSQVSSSTYGEGNAGNVLIYSRESVVFDGSSIDSQYVSSALSTVESGAIGDGGDIEVSSNKLEVRNGARLSASTYGQGNAGNVLIDVEGNVEFIGTSFDNPDLVRNDDTTQWFSAAGSSVQAGASGEGGNLRIDANNVTIANGARLLANTYSNVPGNNDAGSIAIVANDRITFTGTSADGQYVSAAFSNVQSGAIGDGGDIELTTGTLEVSNGAQLISNTFGEGDAGDITLTLREELLMNNGTITTSAESGSGGAVIVTTSSAILEGDSNIVTLVSNGSGQGGDITIAGDFIIALDDSDILASADTSADGSRGGDINFNVRGFFGENFTSDSLTADPDTLDGNDRADINATGTTNGVVTLPDVSFIENSLSDLSDDIVTPDQILIASCISRTAEDQGTFNVTGSGGLSTSPNSDVISAYPTSDIQSPTEATTQTQWQLGDPIDEATGIYELADGRLTLSQDCS